MLTRRRRIVLLGDSLSVGSFPFMARALRTLDGANESFVVAKVGARTEWMASPAQIDKVLAFDPTLVVIMGGTNDLASKTEKGSEDGYLGLLTAVTELREAGVDVVVSTVPPTNTGAREITSRYNDRLLGGVPGARVVDAGAAVLLAELGPDKVHPTLAGYEALGRALARDAVYEPGLFYGLAMLAVAGAVLVLPGV